jgi:hypothetical protein
MQHSELFTSRARQNYSTNIICPSFEKSLELILFHVLTMLWVCTFSEEFDIMPAVDLGSNWRDFRTLPSPADRITWLDGGINQHCEDGFMHFIPDNLSIQSNSTGDVFLNMALTRESGIYAGELTNTIENCGNAGETLDFNFLYKGAALESRGGAEFDDAINALILAGAPRIYPFTGPVIMEARIKVRKENGTFSAFWTNNWNEIDIFEFSGTLDDTNSANCTGPTDFSVNIDDCNTAQIISSNYFLDNPDLVSPGVDCPQHFIIKDNAGNTIDFSEDFHIYTVEFSPLYYNFYIDGSLIRESYRFLYIDGSAFGKVECGATIPAGEVYENFAFPVSLKSRKFPIQLFLQTKGRRINNLLVFDLTLLFSLYLQILCIASVTEMIFKSGEGKIRRSKAVSYLYGVP